MDPTGERDSEHPLSVGQCATLACLLEVTAPKPGNVHRGADFHDVAFVDFAASAVAIAPAMQAAAEQGVGATVLQAVQSTRRVTDTNTNLGTVLLLAPLAAAPVGESLESSMPGVLQRINKLDGQLIYQAIRLAQPGGLGGAPQWDVRDSMPADLLQAMQSAADRDLVARQYALGFRDIFDEVAPSILSGTSRGWCLTDAIIYTQLRLISRFSDTLIERKCGAETAAAAQHQARRVLDAGEPGQPDFFQALVDFDFWLRCDGHRRNPGAVADLLAAGLFVLLRERRIEGPFR